MSGSETRVAARMAATDFAALHVHEEILEFYIGKHSTANLVRRLSRLRRLDQVLAHARTRPVENDALSVFRQRRSGVGRRREIPQRTQKTQRSALSRYQRGW